MKPGNTGVGHELQGQRPNSATEGKRIGLCRKEDEKVQKRTRGEYKLTVFLRRAGDPSHSQLHRVDFWGKGLMPARPRRLALLLQE